MSERSERLTQRTVCRAKSLQRQLLTGLLDAEKAIVADAARGRAAEATEREDRAAMLKEKESTGMELVKKCDKGILEVGAMLRQLGQGLRRLQHTRYAQFADLKVCQQRLHLRADAPNEESRDLAQRALEGQLRGISDARSELLSLEGECRRALEMITELRNELSKESASQRHAAEKCRATAAVLMSVSADDPEDVEVPEANRELLPRADHLLLAAKDLLSRCSKSIQSTDQNCSRLRQRAELLLERRLLETEKSAKLLREHASEVDYTIAVAARSLEKSEKRCSGKENLAKAAKLDSTRNALRHLQETRQAMKLQMQNKLKMQTIDASCRKVTSQSASSPSLGSLSRPVSAGRSVRQDEMEQVRSLPRLDCDGTAQTAEKRMRPQSAATYKARGP